MLSRETPFTWGKNLFYSWTGLGKICDKYGIATFAEFDEKFITRNAALFSITEVVDLLKIGLERKDAKGNLIPVSDAEDNNLIDKYMEDGYAVTDLIMLIIQAIYSSLLRKKQGEVKGEMTPKTIPQEPSPK
jgi:hypothetical protein